MAITGKGAKFFYGTAGSNPSTQIAKVKSITPPAPERPDIDTTHLESEARESLPGLLENGEFEAVIQYSSAVEAVLRAMFDNDDLHSWGYEFNDGSGYQWDGYPKKLGTDGVEVDGVITNSITIKVSGPVLNINDTP